MRGEEACQGLHGPEQRKGEREGETPRCAYVQVVLRTFQRNDFHTLDRAVYVHDAVTLSFTPVRSTWGSYRRIGHSS